MTTTTNLSLQKPAESDSLGASLTAFNGNFDKLDEAVAAKAAKIKARPLSLPLAGWSENMKSISVNAQGITLDSAILVSPSPASFEGYCAAGIRCIGGTGSSLTFRCSTLPTSNLSVYVAQLDGGSNMVFNAGGMITASE